MDLQRLTGYLRKAIRQYNMIEENDVIAVGLSGGKDSLTLLAGLNKLSEFYPVPFSLVAIYVNLGINDDAAPERTMRQFCEELSVPFYMEKTDIYQIVFEARKEKHPCSLCARMRKGTLADKAIELGCTKIAYAHHMDDFMETSIMSLAIEGRYECFCPVMPLDDKNITVIRPMVFIPEKEIAGYARRNHLPVLPNPCPADGNTKRQVTKDWIKESENYFPDIRKNLNSALLKYFENTMKQT